MPMANPLLSVLTISWLWKSAGSLWRGWSWQLICKTWLLMQDRMSIECATRSKNQGAVSKSGDMHHWARSRSIITRWSKDGKYHTSYKVVEQAAHLVDIRLQHRTNPITKAISPWSWTSSPEMISWRDFWKWNYTSYLHCHSYFYNHFLEKVLH